MTTNVTAPVAGTDARTLDPLALYRTMVIARTLNDVLKARKTQGKFPFYIGCAGHESMAAVVAAMDDEDWLAFYYTAREIRRWFPTAKTYPRLFHDAYMHHLGECDFALSTFPFGGTNSLTDAFFLGLPVVAKNGEELHEWWDGHMLRRVGLGQLVAETAVQYEETALELINNPSRLLEQQQLIGDRDKVWRAFFGEPDGVARGAFGRAIAYLWEHRDALRDRAHDYPVNWREFT